MYGQTHSLLWLMLIIGFACIASTIGQSQSVPTRQLLAPSLRFAESFESFDDDGDGDGNSSTDSDDDSDVMQRTREQLRQLLGQQLTNGIAPLTTAPLVVLSQRQPALRAPSSGAEAAVRFFNASNEAELSEEDSDEADIEPAVETDTDLNPGTATATDPGTDQNSQLEYNPYRDNFNEINADGSYVFGYSLPNGVRRWERAYYTEPQHSRVVEGFYAQPRHFSQDVGIQYELRCYRADSQGYHALAVEYLRQPPRVQHNELPNVTCLNNRRY